MRIIICGAGQVGREIALQLGQEGHSITLIDVNPELIKKVAEEMDVRIICGFASHPELLENAGARQADLIIAVTSSDEVNIVICKIAHSIFKVPRKIARIRSQNYLDSKWREIFDSNELPIDVIISPEKEVAVSILERLNIQGANEAVSFAGGKLKIVAIKASANSGIKNISLKRLNSYLHELNIKIVGLVRDQEFIFPDPEETYSENDEIYIACPRADIPKLMAMFGFLDEASRNIVIVGGGNIGFYLASKFEKEDLNVKIIELDPLRAHYIADKLNKTIVIHGNALEPSILNEVNIDHTDLFIAVSNDDKVNILSSLLAKHYGAKQAVTLVNNISVFGPLASLGIDVCVNPGETTISRILSKIKAEQGHINEVYAIAGGKAEIIEISASTTSPVIGKFIEDIEKQGALMAIAIVRAGQILIPTATSSILPDDVLVVVCNVKNVNLVEDYFNASFEYFRIR